MKPTNATLNAILAGRQFFIQDLITFTLQDGTVLTYTSAQKDVVVGGTGFSLSFAGSSDLMREANSLLPPSGVSPTAGSFTAWFKTTSSTGQGIWSCSNNVAGSSVAASNFENMLYVGTGGKLQGGWFDGAVESAISTASVNDGAWHLGVFTFQASSAVKLYLDGVPVGSGTIGTPESPSNVVYWLGYGYGNAWPNLNTQNFFIGKLRDPRAYNRVLSSNEVATLFAGGAVSTSGLQGEYPFASTSSTDASGNGNDGVFAGAPTLVTDAPTVFTTAGATYVSGGVTGPYFDRKDNKAKVVWNLGVGTDTLVIDVVPGSTAQVEGHSWFDAVRLGIFDGADFEIDRGYSTVYGVVQTGCAPMLFKGRVAEVEADRAIITFSINDYRELLNQQMPRWLYAASCQNNLYDASCTLISTNFQSTGTVGAGSSFSFIINSTLAQASGYFDLGKIKFTSGANSGLTFPVSSWSSSLATITLAAQTPFLPVASDQFTIFPGCDLSTANTGCGKFSNIANFRGMPYIPDPGQAI